MAAVGSVTGTDQEEEVTLTDCLAAGIEAVAVVTAGALTEATEMRSIWVELCPAGGVSCGNEIGLIRPGIVAGKGQSPPPSGFCPNPNRALVLWVRRVDRLCFAS